MIGVPVQPVLETQVETDEKDRGGLKLSGEIDGIQTAVIPANVSAIMQHPIIRPMPENPMHAPLRML